MNHQARIKVFTGEGKGKTTSALGEALGAVARGLKVFMVQFMKAPDSTGEHFAAQYLQDLLTILPMGTKGFIFKPGRDQPAAVHAREALGKARAAMLNGDFRVVILDEVNVALFMDLIGVEDVLELIASKPETVELVLTGRNAHPRIVERADCVLEMRKIKHHYDQGVAAGEGIEY